MSNPFTEEMQRTAVQRKVVVKSPPSEALRYATTFLETRGYRAGPGARPNWIFVLGTREGALPRVTAEIAAQGNVGKTKTTLVTISGFGERLGPVLLELVAALRASRTAPEATSDV